MSIASTIMRFLGFDRQLDELVQEAPSAGCHCAKMSYLAVVPMSFDTAETLASLDEIKRHSEEKWWLYVSNCKVCGQFWMIAQEERVHDNFYLKRLLSADAQAIIDHSLWPTDFLLFERVLKLGPDTGHTCQFLDPQSPGLIWTVEDLLSERPSISSNEIAYLLNISTSEASHIVENLAELTDELQAKFPGPKP